MRKKSVINCDVFALILLNFNSCGIVALFREIKVSVLILSFKEKSDRIFNLFVLSFILEGFGFKAHIKSKGKHILFFGFVIKVFVFVNVDKLKKFL